MGDAFQTAPSSELTRRRTKVPLFLKSGDPDFESRFKALLATKREVSEDVDATVRAILDDVRARGDAAVIEYTAKFDRLDLTATPMRVGEEEIAAALGLADPSVVEALRLARDRIRSHHERQMPKDDVYVDPIGVKLGSRWTAVEAVGLYVPGGTASYPSSVLMNAIPAVVAGVERIAMVVPEFSMPTQESRRLLPNRVARNQAIHNIGRAAMLGLCANRDGYRIEGDEAPPARMTDGGVDQPAMPL